MQEFERVMLNEVNKMARRAFNHYEMNGNKWDEIHKQNMNEIWGALRVMSAATGKDYVVNADGTVTERGEE